MQQTAAASSASCTFARPDVPKGRANTFRGTTRAFGLAAWCTQWISRKRNASSQSHPRHHAFHANVSLRCVQCARCRLHSRKDNLPA